MNNFENRIEIWEPVTRLMKFDSSYNIVGIIDICNGYQVSSEGRLKYNDKIRKNRPEPKGYIQDFLFGIDGERYRFKRHQIVMQTFKKAEYRNGFTVDHINRNTKDNRVENLRWVSLKVHCENRENKSYKYKQFLCLNDGKIYKSCQEAEKNYGLVKNTVSRVARGERKSIHGFEFVYTKDCGVERRC